MKNSFQSDSASHSSDEINDAKHLQESNNQLRQKNEKLLLELNSLRSQFNEATSIGTQLEQIHNKNSKLTADLRKVTAEKEELSHRCDLNIQVIEELRNSKEQEKLEMERRIQQEIGDARESFENEKKEMNEILSKTQNELKDAQKLLKASQNDCDSMATSVKNVVEAAQTYFLHPFKNVDQLTEFLSQNKNCNTQSNKENQIQTRGLQNPDQQNSQDEIENLKKQCKVLKQKLKDERRNRKEADGQVLKLDNTLKNMKNQEEQNKANFENSLNDLQKKLELAELQRKTMAATYDNKISELTGLLEEERSRSIQNANQASNENNQNQNKNIDQLKNKIALSANKLKELQSTVFALRKQNSQLVSQLGDSENTKELLRRKYQSTSEENEKLRAAIEQIKLENSTISIERDDLKEQNDTILSQIQAARSSYNQSKAAYSEAECQIEKLQSSLNILEDMIKKQRDEIIENVTARNKYVTSLQKQNEALHQMENLLSNLQEENKSLKAKFDHATVNREINPKLNVGSSINNSTIGAPDNSSNDGIPPTSWFCMEFPRQLCSLISEIANNSALATTAKLRNVLSTIAKFYNKQLDQLKNTIQENDEKAQANNEQLDKLFTSLAPFVNDSSLSAESFNNDPVRKTQNITNALAGIQNSQIDSKLQKTQLQNEMAELLQKLNASTIPQASASVDNLNDQIKKMKEQIDAGKAKHKKLSKTLKALKNAAQQDADDSQLQIESQTGEIKKLQDDNKRLQDQNKHYETVIDQLSSQINGSSLSLLNGNISQPQQQPVMSRDLNLNELSMSTPNHNQNRDKANQAQNPQLMKALKEELESQKANYDSIISDKDHQINDLKDKCDGYEKELQQMRKIAEILKNSKNDRDQQIQNLMNEIDNRDKENKNRLENEKKSLQQQHERSVSQLKGKNTQLRDLISNLSNALNESEERNKVLLATNAQLSIEKQQAQARLETINEEIKRDKQLAEARLKTVELAMSTQNQIEIEEEHSKCDEQKRQIYSFVANQFMMFFDATKNFINEEGFKMLVEKCSSELRRLTKMESSLRRILGLHVNESIEDAVSKILVSIYKH
ncbi:hypothetical protein M9Y10_005529 [Tritrichomonas musculus]|uniref:Viral A-type inclusion protein n=1 Tax=Tritrichomonas musculus TaxID=1915356 RepID=A0ABR2JCA0_9EUKA